MLIYSIKEDGVVMKIIYMSVIGNTRRFVEKLEMDSLELSEVNALSEIDENFIMIAPTYAIEMTDILNDFLETGDNLSYCQGVIGAGNRNFNELYCFTAEDIALDYDVPLLYRFEFQGSDNDVKKVKEIVTEIENTNYV